MLRQLRIDNYELIKGVDQRFEAGLNCITGETGTGKSMILSALHLLAGNRASEVNPREEGKKTILEAHFDADPKLKDLFKDNDLDWDDQILLRREFTSSGRSRAFINDSPVTLDLLKKSSLQLFEVHSQDQTLLLNDPDYQCSLLDDFALEEEDVLNYAKALSDLRTKEQALNELKRRIRRPDQKILRQFRLRKIQGHSV